MSSNDIRDVNREAYDKEMDLSFTILRRNRYDTVTGEWLGPDPEPGKEPNENSSNGEQELGKPQNDPCSSD